MKFLVHGFIIISSFDQSPATYVVNEGCGSVQPVLSLSNSSSINITVQVSTTNRSATGEYKLDLFGEPL